MAEAGIADLLEGIEVEAERYESCSPETGRVENPENAGEVLDVTTCDTGSRGRTRLVRLVRVSLLILAGAALGCESMGHLHWEAHWEGMEHLVDGYGAVASGRVPFEVVGGGLVAVAGLIGVAVPKSRAALGEVLSKMAGRLRR